MMLDSEDIVAFVSSRYPLSKCKVHMDLSFRSGLYTFRVRIDSHKRVRDTFEASGSSLEESIRMCQTSIVQNTLKGT